MMDLRAQFGDQPFPDFLPSYGNLISDRLGFLWAQNFQFDYAAAPTFRVFDPGGALVAHVTLPPRFQVREIGRDYLLGIVWDEYDVEYVWRLPLRR